MLKAGKCFVGIFQLLILVSGISKKDIEAGLHKMTKRIGSNGNRRVKEGCNAFYFTVTLAKPQCFCELTRIFYVSIDLLLHLNALKKSAKSP